MAEYTPGALARLGRQLGKTLARARIYLTGRICIEHGDRLIGERDLPGRQGRLALAFLVVHRHRAVGRDEVASILWPEHEPADSETALSAILSKLRAAFRKVGWLDSGAAIELRSGSMALRVPAETWIDIEAAANALDEAEGALRRRDLKKSWGEANIAASVARRSFLAHDEAPWIEARRRAQRGMLVRALQCLATISAANNESALAFQYTNEIIDLEPFRETAYQQLMRLHADGGNRAEALRVFGRCRELLRDELGTSPSPQTEAVFLEILRAGDSR